MKLCVTIFLLFFQIDSQTQRSSLLPFIGSHALVETGQLQLIQFSHTSPNNEITKDESTINNFTLTPKKIFFSRPQVSLAISELTLHQEIYKKQLYRCHFFFVPLVYQTWNIIVSLYQYNPSVLFIVNLSIKYFMITRSQLPQIVHFCPHAFAYYDSNSRRWINEDKFHVGYQNPVTNVNNLKYWVSIGGYYTFDQQLQLIGVQQIEFLQNQFVVHTKFIPNKTYWLVVYVIIIDQSELYTQYKYLEIIYFESDQKIQLDSSISLRNDEYILGLSYFEVSQPSSMSGFKFDWSARQIQTNYFYSKIKISYLRFSVKKCQNKLYNPRNQSCLSSCVDNVKIENRYCKYVPFCDQFLTYTTCKACVTNYYLVNQTHCERNCYDYSHCSRCNDNQCLQCQQSYFFIFQQKGTCDKCNVQDLMSLNQNNICVCAQHFEKIYNYCIFDETFKISLNTENIIKDPEDNKLIFQITILPDLQVFNYIDFNQILDFGLNSSLKSSFKYEKGLLTAQVYYQEDIHNISTTFSMQIRKYSYQYYVSFYKTNRYSQSYTVLPSNNLVANVYSQTYYKLMKIVRYTVYGIIGLSSIVFVLGSYSSKLVVLEMMTILQISYFGLFAISSESTLLQSTYFLRYSNGYSDITNQYQQQLPSQISNKGYYSQAIANKNILMIFELLPLLIGLACFIVSKVKRHGIERWISYSKLCIGQWVIYSTLFSLSNFSASLTIFFKYFNSSDPLFFVSVTEIRFGIALVLYVLLVYGLTDYNYCGQFKYSFKWSTLSLNYYYSFILLKIVSGAILVAMSDTYLSLIVVSVLFLLMSILTAVAKPYADIYQTARSAFNLLIGSLVFGLYTLMQSQKYSSNSFIQSIPALITTLLAFIPVAGTVFVIKQLKQLLNSKKLQLEFQSNTLKQQQQRHLNLMKEQIKTLNHHDKSDDKNFAKKLFQNKRKPKKKRRITLQPFDSPQRTSIEKELMHFENMEDIMMCQLRKNHTELTVDKVLQLDQMLKNGDFL